VQAVRDQLRRVPAAALADGNRVKLYAYGALPSQIQARLDASDHQLPGPVAARTPNRSAPGDAADDFADILSLVVQCRDAGCPTDDERAAVLEAGCRHIERLRGEGLTVKRSARRVNRILFDCCPFLTRSREYLEKMMRDRFRKWRAQNRTIQALCDGRQHNSGNQDGYAVPQKDLDTVSAIAAFKFEGRIEPAWQEALAKGEISQPTLTHYGLAPGVWSRIPRKIAEAIRVEVQIFNIWRLGRRARDNASGSLIRSYDGISSLDCIMADDFTWPVYFHVIEDGQLLYFGRGQCLLFIDFRSLMVLGWALLPASQYTAFAIYQQCIKTFETYRVPDVLYFERNIWERAKLLKGDTATALTYPEIKTGLSRFGIEFVHAVRPRSKTIERVGGLLQDHMAGERGWCGRLMREDCPEQTQRLIVQIERMSDRAAAAELAAEHFMGFEQRQERLAQGILDYNARPQRHGRILQGLSPKAGFDKFLDKANPHHELDPRIRCLFAPAPRIVRVTVNGIRITEGKVTYKYSGAELQRFMAAGQALAHFDPAETDLMCVIDLDKNVDSTVCVSREPEPNALEMLICPESGTLARAARQNAGTTADLREQFPALKAKYKTIEPPCLLPKRQTVLSPETVALARLGGFGLRLNFFRDATV
jgi:hypothetical protein